MTRITAWRRHPLARYAVLILALALVGTAYATFVQVSRPADAALTSGKVDDVARGKSLFEAHCASCHGNDGSGTAMGKSFYPPVPDMRRERTQDLTDGELFSIIENGIRLTGMPAWGNGTPDGEASSWALVHFIRRLPTLPPDDIARMQDLNPKSPAEFREEEEARRFLAGDEPATTPRPMARPGHH